MAVMTGKVKDAYLERVNEFPLCKIKDDADYRRASAIFSRFAGHEKIEKGTSEYLNVLADLIADYETRLGQVIDISAIGAAEVVRHLMAENDLTISGLARQMGIGHSNLSEMLSGRRDWSKRVIKGLSERFGLNPMLFFR